MKTDDIAHPVLMPNTSTSFRKKFSFSGETVKGRVAKPLPFSLVRTYRLVVTPSSSAVIPVYWDSRIRHRDVEDNPLHHQFALAGDVQGVVSHDRTGHGRGIRVSLLRRDLSLFRRNTQADGGGGARILQ